MATLRNRYHEKVWYLGRHGAEPDETIEVPDHWVEDRDADGKLLGGLAEDDLFWERLDRPAISRAELDAMETAADVVSETVEKEIEVAEPAVVATPAVVAEPAPAVLDVEEPTA